MKNISKIFLLIFVIPLLVFAENKIQIHVKNNAVVLGSAVYMKDVASISGTDAELVNKVKNIILATSPKPGISRDISSGFIISRLKQNQIEKDMYTLSGSKKVIVTAKYIEIKAEDIKKCINDYLDKNIDPDADRNVQFSKVPVKVKAPAKDVSLNVIPKKYGNLKGLINIKVGIYNGERLFSKLNIPVRVRVFENVIVAKKNLKRNEVIVAGDLELKKIETTSYGNRFFRNMKEIIGKRSKVTLKEGKILRRNMIEDPPIISRGEIITLKSIFGSIEIVTNGKAKEDGWVGKVIRVYCNSSKKDVLAEVTGKGTAVLR